MRRLTLIVAVISASSVMSGAGSLQEVPEARRLERQAIEAFGEGDRASTFQLLDSAEASAQAAGDVMHVVRLNRIRAQVFQRLGRFDECCDAYERCIGIAEDAKLTQRAGRDCTNYGMFLKDLGRYSDARRVADRAEQLLRSDEQANGKYLMNVAGLLTMIESRSGNPRASLEYAQLAVDRGNAFLESADLNDDRIAKDVALVATFTNNLGYTKLQLLELDGESQGIDAGTIRSLLEHGLSLRRQAQAPAEDVARSLINLAQLELHDDAEAAARQHLEAVLVEFRNATQAERDAGIEEHIEARIQLARLARKTDPEVAMSLLTADARLSDQARPLWMRSIRLERADLIVATSWGDDDAVDSAFELLTEATTIAQPESGAGGALRDVRASAAWSVDAPWRSLAILAARQGRHGEALEHLRRAGGDASSEVLHAEPGVATLAFVWRPHAVTLLVLTEHGARSFPIATGYDDVEALGDSCATYFERLTRPRGLEAVKTHGLELGTRLLPVEVMSLLRDATVCRIVPDGPLGAIPLETLCVRAGEGTIWLDAWSNDQDLELRYAARLTARAPTSAPLPRDCQVLALADPAYPEGIRRLEWTSHEAEALRRSVAATNGKIRMLARSDANLAAFEAALDESTPDIIHVGAHGRVGARSTPQSSRLLLASSPSAAYPDDLTLARIDRTWRPQRLLDGCAVVVLAACETQRGVRLGGAGVISLAWGFLEAGATRVVASQWPASDQASAVLMTAFYEALLRDGRSPAAALREARAEVRARVRGQDDPNWAHPRYWAPFVLVER